MEIKVTAHHFLEMIKKGHSIDVIFLLKLAEEGSIKDWCESNVKIKNLYQGMLRKGLLIEGGTISLEGKSLLAFLDTPEDVKWERSDSDSGAFLGWWNIYPPTDTFTHKNRTFSGTRALRTGKPRCEVLFNKIVNKGEYTAQEIIAATEFDIRQKKENSIKKSSNHLTFMQNSQTYLFNDSYEGFINLIREGEAITEGATKANEIDI